MAAARSNPAWLRRRRTNAMELALDTPRLPRAPEPATILTVVANDCSDGELILRPAGGDRGAFDVLYRRYARPVFGLALRRLGDRGRAEDAVQETFASILRAARRYRPQPRSGAPPAATGPGAAPAPHASPPSRATRPPPAGAHARTRLQRFPRRPPPTP